MTLTKEQILNAKDYELVKVEVPEWGGTIYVKPLSGTVRNRLVAQVKQDKIDDIQLQVLINTMCDDNGNLIFSAQDIKALGEKNSEVLARIEKVACDVSGLSSDGQEELAKN